MRPFKTKLSLLEFISATFFRLRDWNACDTSTIFDERRICCNRSPRFMRGAKSWNLSSRPHLGSILRWSSSGSPLRVSPVERLRLGFTSSDSLLLGAECKAVWTAAICYSGLNERNWLDSKGYFPVADLLTCILKSWTLRPAYILLTECRLLISFPFYHLTVL